MVYSAERLNILIDKVSMRIKSDLIKYNAVGEADQLIKKFGYSDLIENYYTGYDFRNAHILVIGATEMKESDIMQTFKKMGVNPKHVTLITDYDKIKSFDFKNLRYSSKYSDIIMGPQPHKGINIDGNSSAIAMMQSNPEEFPKMTRAIANSELKISKESLKRAIEQTQYYEYWCASYN